jgi:signal transduction histidine kinase
MDMEAVGLDPKKREVITESIQLANRCMEEIRDFSYLLHPPTLDEFGLVPALRSYSNGFARRTGIQVEVDLSGDPRRLPRDVELALFRVVQECLANVQRHSGSPVVRIRLLKKFEKVTLEVEDEGCGFQVSSQDLRPSGSGTGLGLVGMKERIRDLGGRLEIQSDSSGTTIKACLPTREAVT